MKRASVNPVDRLPGPLTGADRVGEILARLSPADSALLAELLDQLEAPSRRRAQRLAERDQALRELAARHAALGSGRQLAAAVHDDLARYAAARWQAERGRSPSRRHASQHRILTLTGGKVLSAEQIRRVLAGVRFAGAKSGEEMPHRVR
jgi:hypothetical protein